MAISLSVSPNIAVLSAVYVGLRKYLKITLDCIDPAAAIPAGTFQLELTVPSPTDTSFSLRGGVGEGWSAAGATISVNVPPAPASTTSRRTAILSFQPLSSSVAGSVDVGVTLKQGAAVVSTTSVEVSYDAAVPIPSALVMVLDRSGSMSSMEGTVSRAQRLRNAANRCLSLMADTDHLGVVAFNHTVAAPDPLTMGELVGNRPAAETLFTSGSALNPSGATSIGAGVLQGEAVLSSYLASTTLNRALLVVTDGQENTAPMLSTVTVDDDAYAVGIGTPTTVAVNALTLLTNGTGRYTVLTGALTGDNQFKLDKYFIQIQGDAKNTEIVSDPEGNIGFGDAHKLPFHISDVDAGFEAILLCPQADRLTFELETPDGKRLTPASVAGLVVVEYKVGPGIAFYRLIAAPKQHGRWVAHVAFGRKSEGRDKGEKGMQLAALVSKPARLPYAFLVRATSSLRLTASLTASGLNVGADVLLGATLTEGGIALDAAASVHATLTFPDGTKTDYALSPTAPGRFEASVRGFSTGLYSAHYYASGVTLAGVSFTREAQRTVTLLAAGQVPPDGLSPIPSSEGGPGAPGGAGTPGGGLGTGPGSTGFPPGSLGDLFARFPELERLIRRCCQHSCAHDSRCHCKGC